MKSWFVLLTAIVTSSCSVEKTDLVPLAPAERIVSLAPNLTELIYTVGADELLVGVSAWSDYPREVLELPVVGDAFTVDQEQLALLEPDLLLVWESGTSARIVEELSAMGYTVASIRTRELDDIADAILQIGNLTGHQEQAEQAARAYRAELNDLRDAHTDLPSLRVFYQVAARPLYTVNNEHYISELISVCGGENIFADLDDLAPTIDVEAVIDRDPEVMLASTDAGDSAFSVWDRWPDIAANRQGNQFQLPADEIGRATTRVLIAGSAMCLGAATSSGQSGQV